MAYNLSIGYIKNGPPIYCQSIHMHTFAINMLLLLKKFGFRSAQCSKWYEIFDMEFSQKTEENPDPPTNPRA